MAGSIGTQRRLGGKDTFNPWCAVPFPFAPLSVSPAQHLLASPGLSLQLMASQMFGLNKVLRLIIPFDLVVLALGALGAHWEPLGVPLLTYCPWLGLHPYTPATCYLLLQAQDKIWEEKNPVSCSPSILWVSAEVADPWCLGWGKEAEHSRDRGAGHVFCPVGPWEM